jgi:hypothetical protein
MLTGHFCFIAAELGLSVAGASVGGPGDLRHWLRPAKIPCFDARREKLPAGQRLAAEMKPLWLRIGGYWYPRGGIPIDVFWQTGAPPEGLWVPDQGVAAYRGRG